MLRRIKMIIGLVMFSIISSIGYGFMISDITFDEEIGGNGYKEYKITNDSNYKAIYKVTMVGETPEVTEGMSIYPKILSIDANSTGILKIFGGEKTSLPKGEYKFYLSFKPIVVPTLKKDKNDGKINGAVAAGIAPVLEMRGHVGKIDYSKDLIVTNLKISETKDGQIVCDFDVENHSYGGITIGAMVYDKGKNISDSKRIGRIAKNTKVHYSMFLSKSFKKIDDVRYIDLYSTYNDKVNIKARYDVKKGKNIPIKD